MRHPTGDVGCRVVQGPAVTHRWFRFAVLATGIAIACAPTGRAAAQPPTPPPETRPLAAQVNYSEPSLVSYDGRTDFLRSLRLPPPNNITWNGGALLRGFVALEYERTFGRWVSLFGGPSLYVFNSGFGLFGDIPEGKALEINLGARLYLSDLAPRGFWLGPKLGAGFASSGNMDSFLWSVSASLGYNWLFGESFLVSVGGGVGYLHTTDIYDTNGNPSRGVWLDSRIALGCVF